jgi:hypothetical protein
MRLALVLVSTLVSGCVTVYQPLLALQRPVAIDPHQENFKGTRVLVRCIPGDWADGSESTTLCENVSELLSNQGAVVDVEVPGETLDQNDQNEQDSADPRARAVHPAGKPDLIMELTARRLHNDNSPLLWFLCVITGTLIPAITDATFAQDIAVRDSDGFLLVSESLQARFIRYFGLMTWAVNGLLDLIVRPKGEGLTGNNAKVDFSHDFHKHVSQLTFTAGMREKVLHNFQPTAAASANPK